MLKTFTLVGIGGAIGSICRYAAAQYIHGRFAATGFPFGTFVVNITGCFLIGLLFSISVKAEIVQEWRLFLVTGICGGYTTFSAFSYESVSLLRNGNIQHFILYVAGSVILGLTATFIPLFIAQKLG